MRPDTVVVTASRARLAARPRIAAGVLLLLLGLLAASLATAAERTLPDFSTLVAEVGPAVVNIRVTGKEEAMGRRGMPAPEQIPEYFRRFFENPPGGEAPEPRGPRGGFGQGSGFIVSKDGLVLTNAHVVDGATEIRVIFQDRREYDARLIGSDKRSDVAVLQIDADEDLPSVKLGNSDDLRVGQWVLAIGNPFGFEQTATQGIVSALSRSLPDENYVPFIQTDVAVNPGNSGGPLFDAEGRVVGINSQIYSRTGGYMGLSFAIPINMAVQVSEQLRTKGFVSRGWLGVAIQDLDQSLAESFGLQRPTGALVASVTEGSPADKAGLRTGDVILSFQGTNITRSGDLPPVVAATPAGTRAKVLVRREGKQREISVEVGTLADESPKVAGATPQAAPGEEGRLGVVVHDAEDGSGVVVRNIDPDGPAARAGIRRGDVILSFDRQAVKSARQLSELVKESPSDKPIAVLIQRDSATQFVALTLPKA